MLLMGVIRTNAAAAMLGVSPNTLRSWERRFDYRRRVGRAGGIASTTSVEIEALRSPSRRRRTSLRPSPWPASAHRPVVPVAPARRAVPVRRARGRSAAGGEPRGALGRAHGGEVLLPAIESLVEGDALSALAPPPEYVFAARWATGWLSAVRRVAPPASRPDGVLVFDASRPGDLDSLHAQALELTLRGSGWRT